MKSAAQKILATLFVFFFGDHAVAHIQLNTIKLPQGFKIGPFASGVTGARSMAWGTKGTLFVGTRGEGKVYAIDTAGKVHTIARALNSPNGVAFKNGTLYVAEIHRIIMFPGIEDRLTKPPQPKVFNDAYPDDRHHGWKYIAFGPDGKLYVSQGAPCNVCEPREPFASITTLTPDGKTLEVFARGVRNSVGFDWHPMTKELWFTDNGRDMLGDDVPPDELNHAPRPGMHFGFPYCHGDILDVEFGKKKRCSDYVAPKKELGPHVAALGMKFYNGKMFPVEYKNQIFIAEHGSWNRKDPIGYRIMLVRLNEKDEAISYETFAEGWLQGREPWGRPSDIIITSDGALLVSDDLAGAIYKIQYKK